MDVELGHQTLRDLWTNAEKAFEGALGTLGWESQSRVAGATYLDKRRLSKVEAVQKHLQESAIVSSLHLNTYHCAAVPESPVAGG
jgi:hypothetical protein